MRLGMIGFVATIMLVGPTSASGQSWQFTKSSPLPSEASAFAGADAGSKSDRDGGTHQGELLADAGATATAEDTAAPGNAFATSVGAATAMCLTPVDATTLLPTNHSAIIQSQIVDSSAPKFARTFEGTGAAATSISSFQLEGAPIAGFLRGSVYVVGLVDGSVTGSGLIGGGAMVHATVNGFGISADYNGDGLWSIGLTRPDSTMNITATGVNQFLTFTIPISLPLTVDIDTSTNSSVSMRTLGTSGGHAEVQVVLAATGWAQFSPTEAAPPPGDFNGDGFVDGSDFLALQRGIGTDLAPSLSQGDANHDGIIDALDVQSWKSSFGSSLLASSVASPEPATGTIALALLWLPLSCSRTACRGLDRSTRKQSP